MHQFTSATASRAATESPPPSLSAWAFFREFLRSPKCVGSVIPTSQTVVSSVIERLDLENCDLFVEYGPGPGNFTRELLKSLPATAQLLTIDLNPRFCEHLKSTIHDPRLTVVEGSATDVRSIIEKHYGPDMRANYILSGLPFSTLPVDVRTAIMNATHDSLAADGAMVVYQYSRLVEPLLHAAFGRVTRRLIWRNVPPCYVFMATRDGS